MLRPPDTSRQPQGCHEEQGPGRTCCLCGACRRCSAPVTPNEYRSGSTAWLPPRQKPAVSFQRSSRQFTEGPPAPQKKTRSIGSMVEQVWWFPLGLWVLE